MSGLYSTISSRLRERGERAAATEESARRAADALFQRAVACDAGVTEEDIDVDELEAALQTLGRDPRELGSLASKLREVIEFDATYSHEAVSAAARAFAEASAPLREKATALRKEADEIDREIMRIDNRDDLRRYAEHNQRQISRCRAELSRAGVVHPAVPQEVA